MNYGKSMLTNLENAISNADRPKINDLIEELNPNNLNDTESARFLRALKDSTYFPELINSAQKYRDAGIEQARVKILQSQALIEEAQFDEAEILLKNTSEKLDWNAKDKSEAVGLLGRVNKQKYVHEGDQKFLEDAIGFYKKGWEHKVGDYRWHGINYVACLARLNRDNASKKNGIIVEDVSREILNEIEIIDSDKKATVWDFGTAMEACVALNLPKEEIFEWAKKYINHPQIDSFELASTTRQLLEIWQMGDTDIGGLLLPVLQHKLVNSPGGVLQLSQVKLGSDQGFEAIYGLESALKIKWLLNLLEKCKAIVKIIRHADGSGVGSGFVVRGSDLNAGLLDAPYLITNAHVIAEDPSESDALRPNQARVVMEGAGKNEEFEIGKCKYYSPKEKLDVWISEINIGENTNYLDIAPYVPVVPDTVDRIERIFVIGHPLGGPLSISMFDNELVGFAHPYVHYKSPTQKGSSGSAALNSELEVFAVHHKTRRKLAVNQGVLLSEIIKAIS